MFDLQECCACVNFCDYVANSEMKELNVFVLM